jgi:hypothetical protein
MAVRGWYAACPRFEDGFAEIARQYREDGARLG